MISNTLIPFIISALLLSLASSQQYNCIQGFAFNATYSSCMPTSIVCPQGSSWNSQICAYSVNCPTGSVFNGTTCAPYANSCPPGYYGNTSQCFRCPTGFVQYYNSVQCTINFGNCSAGSYWTGSACATSNQPQNNSTPTLPPTLTPQNTNLQLGSTLNSQNISTPIGNPTIVVPTLLNPNNQFPINPPQNTSTVPSSAGQSILCSGGFYWTGSQCAYFNGVYACLSGYTWNGTHCSNSTVQNPTNQQTNQLLTQSGSCSSPYYWNGNACVYSLGQPTCADGYTWNSSTNSCVQSYIQPTPPPQQPQPQLPQQPQPQQPQQITCTNPYYFNGATCVYNTGQPQCLNNFVFNLTSNRCQQTTQQTQNICNPPFYFNGINCMYNGGQIICAPGFLSNGTGCVNQTVTQSARGPADCNSSTFWNGINCVPFNGFINCTSGYSWNGQQCAMSPPPNCSGGQVVNPSTNMCVPATQTFCSNGNFWNGEACTRYTGQYTCISRFYYNGVNCIPVTGYVNALNNENTAL